MTFVLQDGTAQAGGAERKTATGQASLFHPLKSHNLDNESHDILGGIKGITSASVLHGSCNSDFNPSDASATPANIYDIHPNNGGLDAPMCPTIASKIGGDSLGKIQ